MILDTGMMFRRCYWVSRVSIKSRPGMDKWNKDFLTVLRTLLSIARIILRYITLLKVNIQDVPFFNDVSSLEIPTDKSTLGFLYLGYQARK